MEQSVIAERLVELRKNASLSQARVAEILSVSRQAVSKWESGKASPSIACYSTLASLYGVTPDMLLSGKDFESDAFPPVLAGNSFAERLRSLRAVRALSQGELADAIAVSRQSVSKWERGEAEPDADRLLAISSFLDVPLALLFPQGEDLPKEALVDEVSCEKAPDEQEEEIQQEEAVEKAENDVPSAEVSKEEAPSLQVPAQASPAPEVKMPQDGETPKIAKPTAPSKLQHRKGRQFAFANRSKKHTSERTAAQAKEEKKIEFRTISDIGPNDPAYVYVNKSDGKVRTVLPFLAAIPICTAAIALMVRKKYKN